MRSKQSPISARTVKLSLPTLSLTLPTLPQVILDLPESTLAFVKNIFSKLRRERPPSNYRGSSFWDNFRRRRTLLIAGLVLIISALAVTQISRVLKNKDSVSGSTTNTISVNREFEFPLKDGKGEPTDIKIKYTVTTVDKTKTIIIKGQKATAISGRAFLIANLKLENPSKTPLSMKTRDFIRLLPEGSSDRLAPDIHNDPTEIQPISTKLTRVGFPVDESIRNFKLLIGEIGGEKQEIDLSF